MVLIGINAFFVTAEFSIVSIRRSRIQQLVSAGDIQAQAVQGLQRSIERLLSTTQLGITLSSLALGWIGESAIADLLAQLIQFPPSRHALAHSISVPVAFFLIAYLQIVLGELCPKSLALIYSEQLARFLGPPSLAIARFFNPFVWILNQSTRLLLRLAGVKYTRQEWYNRVTSEELQLIISNAAESTGLEAQERELLNNVLEFGEVTAQAVMVPRTNIVELSRTDTFQALLEAIAVSGHSRYPVIGESLDDIQGLIDFKELADPLATGSLNSDTPITAWIRPARFVPEYMPLHQLLALMQRANQAMVIVLDEFGGTAGLITLKDLVAEIIGDVSETEEEPNIKVLDEGKFLINAQIDIEALNEELDLNLPTTEDYQTLGGFFIAQAQKIPVEGETIQYQQVELTLTAANGPRLQKIQLRDLPQFSPHPSHPILDSTGSPAEFKMDSSPVLDSANSQNSSSIRHGQKSLESDGQI